MPFCNFSGVVLAVQDLVYQQSFTHTKGLYSVVVITLGFDPSNPSSNPGTTFLFVRAFIFAADDHSRYDVGEHYSETTIS